MGLLRHRGEHAAPGTRYRMRERMLSVGDDSWIEDDQGRRVFHVDGKALRIRKTFVLEDADGREVAKLQERKLSVRDRMEIERDGHSIATVKKALVGIRDRFHVEVEGGDDMKVHGNVVDHEYKIERDGDKVAEISKKWFRVRDTYGVEVFDETEVILILAITVAVDALAHDLL